MARPRIRYSPNFGGIRKIMTGDEMVAVMAKAARNAIPHAQSISNDLTGTYDASFEVETTRRGGPRRNRAEARLVNTARHANDVERRQRVLGQTVDFIERNGAG